MPSRNKYPGLDPAILKNINFHARHLKKRPCFGKESLEDIEQMLLLEVYAELPKYDPSKSSLTTFMSAVLSRRTNNMIARSMAQKRGHSAYTLSVEQTVFFLDPQEKNNTNPLIDCLIHHKRADNADMPFEVERVMARLPEQKKVLCQQLKENTISEVARRNGRSRAAIYRDLDQLKPIFYILQEGENQ